MGEAHLLLYTLLHLLKFIMCECVTSLKKNFFKLLGTNVSVRGTQVPSEFRLFVH